MTIDKARAFAALHLPGRPLILFNAWDAGSAKVIAEAGAAAIATGSASVAMAHGAADREQLPIDLALANAARIVGAVDVPVTIDFEGGYATDPEPLARNMAALAETGAIGCNFEDQVIGGTGLHPIDVQARRIAAARGAVGMAFFINARTDIFLKLPAEAHDRSQADAAIERAHAYAEAGASGLFVPGLIDLRLIERVCRASPLPVNYMNWPGGPGVRQLAEAGVARISHAAGPWRLAMTALGEAARAALAG